MLFKNYMEDVVIELFNDYLEQHPQFCHCERCRADTIVFALSKLKGKYAVSPEGEVFARLSREDRQVRADALLMVMEAAEQVAKSPHH